MNFYFEPHPKFKHSVVVVMMDGPKLEPRVVEGEVKLDKIIKLFINFNHIFADGSDAPKLMKEFQKVFDQPEKFF